MQLKQKKRESKKNYVDERGPLTERNDGGTTSTHDELKDQVKQGKLKD